MFWVGKLLWLSTKHTINWKTFTMPSCTVHSKWFKVEDFHNWLKNCKNIKVFLLKPFALYGTLLSSLGEKTEKEYNRLNPLSTQFTVITHLLRNPTCYSAGQGFTSCKIPEFLKFLGTSIFHQFATCSYIQHQDTTKFPLSPISVCKFILGYIL